MQEQFTELLKRPKGFVLFSALPAGGLRTTLDVVLQGMDRFLREFVAVEDEANRYTAVENVPVTTYKASAGESPAAVLVKLFRKEPNVVVVRDLVDGQTVSLLCRETAQNDRLMIGSIRAKDAAEAIAADVDAEGPAAGIRRGRLRACCASGWCGSSARRARSPTLPPPKCCNSWAFPRAASARFYRPRQPKPDEEKKEVCPECGGVGYKGQTAIFELIVVDDLMRKYAGRHAEARPAPPGRPKGRHEEPAGGRHPAGRPRRHLPAGVDAGDETVREEESKKRSGVRMRVFDVAGGRIGMRQPAKYCQDLIVRRKARHSFCRSTRQRDVFSTLTPQLSNS